MLKQVLLALLLSAPLTGSAALAGGVSGPVALSPAASARAVVTGNDAALGVAGVPGLVHALHHGRVLRRADLDGRARHGAAAGVPRGLRLEPGPDRAAPRLGRGGPPRAYSWALRRTPGQDTVAARIELLIGPAGQVVQTREWGDVHPEHRVPWPTLERELRPADLREVHLSATPHPLTLPLLSGARRALAKAITLVESTRPEHEAQAQSLLSEVLPRAGRSVRIGLTGVPGVGKSTFIEALGVRLADAGHRVAVLAVDPAAPGRAAASWATRRACRA